MKQVLIIMLLTCLASTGFAENSKLEEISLDELLRDYLPDCKIKKEVILDGKYLDFAAAKDTGEITAVTHVDNDFNVYFLEKNGEIKWKKRFSGKGYETRCSISDNGTSVIITNYISVYAENTVLDNNGNILFNKKLKDIELKSSPDGKYFYERLGSMSARRGLKIYNEYGNEIKLCGYDFTQKERSRIIFLNKHEIIAYVYNKLLSEFLFFEFEDGKFTEIWKYELGQYYNFEEYYFQNSLIFNENMIIASCNDPKDITCFFDYDGNSVIQEEFYGSLSFLSTETAVLLQKRHNESLLRILDIKTIEYIDFAYNFDYRNSYNIFKFDNLILFNERINNVNSSVYLAEFRNLGQYKKLKNTAEIYVKNENLLIITHNKSKIYLLGERK